VNSATVEHDESKPVARQRKLMGPTKKNHFFFCYQTLIYVAAGETYPQPHYQTASKKLKARV